MKKNNYSIENLNNRVNKAFDQFCYAGDANLFNSYKMMFMWWMEEETNEKLENLKKACWVDFVDFISSTSIAINEIMKGKTEFDFDNVHSGDYSVNPHFGCDKETLKKYYIDVDGIKIQKHNKVLKEYSLDLIDYIFACLGYNDFGIVTFHKYHG